MSNICVKFSLENCSNGARQSQALLKKEIIEIATEIHPHSKMVYPNRVCSTTTLNEEHSNTPMDYGYESRISPGKPWNTSEIAGSCLQDSFTLSCLGGRHNTAATSARWSASTFLTSNCRSCALHSSDTTYSASFSGIKAHPVVFAALMHRQRARPHHRAYMDSRLAFLRCVHAATWRPRDLVVDDRAAISKFLGSYAGMI